MSRDRLNALIKKYLAAESTLDEEETLRSAENQNPTMQAWSTYVKWKRKKAPANLNDTIWASIQTRRKKRRRVFYTLSGVAASIILFFTISLNNTNNKSLSYEEKSDLLNEALSMFSNERQTLEEQNIIYEDDMIVIYTTPK